MASRTTVRYYPLLEYAVKLAWLTRPRRTRKLAELKQSFMVPAWVMIICWAYLELLVITRTDKLQLASAIKLPLL